jgi:5'-nucleotidase
MLHFLVSNDDGIDAPGLAALAEIAREFGRVSIVAPHEHLSGCSHQTTTHRPLRPEKRDAGVYALNGTPADCVRLALLHLTPNVDWVLSGINDGGNLGVDVYMSGTVAAAREATLLGTRAIALSQYRRSRHEPDWIASGDYARRTIQALLKRGLTAGEFWNVNFPDLADEESAPKHPPLIDCELDPHPLTVAYDEREGLFHFQSNYHSRNRLPNHDVDVCFRGQIALTRITHASHWK